MGGIKAKFFSFSSYGFAQFSSLPLLTIFARGTANVAISIGRIVQLIQCRSRSDRCLAPSYAIWIREAGPRAERASLIANNNSDESNLQSFRCTRSNECAVCNGPRPPALTTELLREGATTEGAELSEDYKLENQGRAGGERPRPEKRDFSGP